MYYFYLTDHLENNRVVVNQNGTVVQTTQYYPFGMVFADGMGQNVQPYKYNSKELDSDRGLNWYDYVARGYDPASGRFMTVDPLAEKYYSISPYVYCGNNPVNAYDLHGDSIWFTIDRNQDNEIIRLTLNVTGKVLNDSNSDINMSKAISTISGAIKDAYKGKIGDVEFVTNIQLTATKTMEDVNDSDHLFVLTDKISHVKDAEIPGVTNMLGGKVAFIDSDYFIGPYDVTVGKHGEGGRSSAHEFGHMVGLGHVSNPLNLMRQGGAFRSIGSKQLTTISDNQPIFNRGANYTLNLMGKKRPNRGNGSASIYVRP